MTPAIITHLLWRVSVLRDRLKQRLASPHEIVRHNALEHQQVAAMLDSLTTTPESAYTDAQRVWLTWLVEAARLYQEYDWRADYAGYLAACSANSINRDMALAHMRGRQAA